MVILNGIQQCTGVEDQTCMCLNQDNFLTQHVLEPTRAARVLYTIFNKIATQGAPQMAVDKEANSLSRVYSYDSKFNLCLFYV